MASEVSFNKRTCQFQFNKLSQLQQQQKQQQQYDSDKQREKEATKSKYHYKYNKIIVSNDRKRRKRATKSLQSLLSLSSVDAAAEIATATDASAAAAATAEEATESSKYPASSSPPPSTCCSRRTKGRKALANYLYKHQMVFKKRKTKYQKHRWKLYKTLQNFLSQASKKLLSSQSKCNAKKRARATRTSTIKAKTKHAIVRRRAQLHRLVTEKYEKFLHCCRKNRRQIVSKFSHQDARPACDKDALKTNYLDHQQRHEMQQACECAAPSSQTSANEKLKCFQFLSKFRAIDVRTPQQQQQQFKQCCHESDHGVYLEKLRGFDGFSRDRKCCPSFTHTSHKNNNKYLSFDNPNYDYEYNAESFLKCGSHSYDSGRDHSKNVNSSAIAKGSVNDCDFENVKGREQQQQRPEKQPHSAIARKLQWRRCYDLQKIVRIFLPILLIVNMFTFLHGVASDTDASVISSSLTEARSRISVVEYLEPLSRPTKAPKCDQTFVSRPGGPPNGTFNAPLLHNPTNHSRQCLYIFLAGPGQRVEIVFTSFNLRGQPPGGAAVGELPVCVHEFMDVYAEVQSSDPAELINSPFGGRYCGPTPPRRRISLYRAIALSYYTSKNETTPEMFEGRYTFLNESEYEIGTPVAGSPCSYTVKSDQKKTGNIVTPTYPGAYPKDMSCTYQFIGSENQRVRIEFRDFDLFFGGPHCPFDFARVYDGPDNNSAIIGTYCGQQRNLVLYSSESSLFVHFFTLQRTATTQNRGFKGNFEFSESFVHLDFIKQYNGVHIRGSECDQKILSKKESTGFVNSPNFPYLYLQKVVCRYFIYGMQDAQNLERVKLEFDKFEIPKGEHKPKGDSNCTDGYLKIYLKGQETTDSYDKFDYELCGKEKPTAVVSDGPRLVMVFSSGDLQGQGFKAKYTFETEYKIPGTAAPDGTCSFTYRSTSKKKGEFNSPRYPSNYPSETNCSFVFLATPNEQVTIVFDHFKVKADSANTTGGAYGLTVCYEDWLEMYVLYRDGTDRFLGRYCGLTAPGPVESPRGAVGIRVLLHTDQENVASGFKARYIFEVAKSVFGDCGGNYTGLDSGIITSPNFPNNYEGPGKGLASRACNWYITARAGYKILLNFEYFGVEGDPAGRGCAAAVLRLWLSPDSDMPPLEMCGEKGATEHWKYLTQGQTARVSFTSADKAIGAQGFRIVWTEVQDSGPSTVSFLCELTYHFQCTHSNYCIANRLRCDTIKNCGPADDSDEMHCTRVEKKEEHDALIISSIAAASFLICLLCTLCHRKRKRKHHRQLGLHRNAAHYDSTTSATGLGSSRRHLQGGGSLSGSLHGISSGSLRIPPAPLPPTNIPPHICISGGIITSDDINDDPYINEEHYINGESV